MRLLFVTLCVFYSLDSSDSVIPKHPEPHCAEGLMSGYVRERERGESRCWIDKARQSQKEGKEKSSY